MADIKERIRKLLALGRSPNESEAMAAIAKANELIQLHDINENDLESLSDNLYELLISDTAWERAERQPSKIAIWQRMIADGVGRWQGCVATSTSHVVSFYGNSGRAAVALAMYEYLCDAAMGLWKDEKRKLMKEAGVRATHLRSVKTPFLYGVAGRIFNEIYDRYLEPDNLEGKEGLILSTTNSARDYLRSQLSDMETRKSSRPQYSKSSAARLGYMRGEEIGIDAQLENQGRKQLEG